MKNVIEMKTLGLLGGTSWHATLQYYSYINESVNHHFGDNTNPPLLIFNMNQSLIHKYQTENNWLGIADILIEGGKRLQRGGAEMLMFCANTPHKVYDLVSKELDIPILHIADATAHAIHHKKIQKVLFFGTKYSMIEDFITQRIADNGIEVFTPNDIATIEELHRIIQKELTYGNVVPESKSYILKLIQSYNEKGVEGIILGCTEFPLMIHQQDLALSVFNTTEIHAQAGIDFILKG